MDDLAVIIVSTNEARWLRPCLSTLFAHLGALRADVVVADNRSTDGTRELVESEFPEARVVTCDNYGFGHANNRALLTTNARYVVFLNPDTEIREGSFADLLARMDASPGLGLAGVKQITPDGRLFPTIRRFPNVVRALFQALGSERYPLRASWLGERELDLSRYEHEFDCDWTSGSFMLARREALESAGYFDERFFIYSEETDLCLRIKSAGWDIRHLADHDRAPPRPEGRRQSEDGCPRRVLSEAIQPKALLPGTSQCLPRRSRPRLWSSRRCSPTRSRGCCRATLRVARSAFGPARAHSAAIRITPEGRRCAEGGCSVRWLEARDHATRCRIAALPPPPAASEK